jgi:hypothetical protein
VISLEGIVVDPDKVRDVLDWKSPISVTQFPWFGWLLSKVNSEFSKISKPVTELLKNDNKYVWSKDCEEAFKTLKKLLTTSPILA